MNSKSKPRKPVIAVRVPATLHKQITKSARLADRSMSQEIAIMIERGLEWTRKWKGGVELGKKEIVISRMNLEPGDVVVLRTDLTLTVDQGRQLIERAREQLPEGVKVMVLSHGLSIDVIKPVPIDSTDEPMGAPH